MTYPTSAKRAYCSRLLVVVLVDGCLWVGRVMRQYCWITSSGNGSVRWFSRLEDGGRILSRNISDSWALSFWTELDLSLDHFSTNISLDLAVWGVTYENRETLQNRYKCYKTKPQATRAHLHQWTPYFKQIMHIFPTKRLSERASHKPAHTNTVTHRPACCSFVEFVWIQNKLHFVAASRPADQCEWNGTGRAIHTYVNCTGRSPEQSMCDVMWGLR